jgi:hypothetical protein
VAEEAGAPRRARRRRLGGVQREPHGAGPEEGRGLRHRKQLRTTTQGGRRSWPAVSSHQFDETRGSVQWIGD